LTFAAIPSTRRSARAESQRASHRPSASFRAKNLFALGDGGLIAVNDAELARRLRMLRFHGSESKKEFLYVGYNSRLDAMQASFLRIFLKHLNDWNAQRREAAARYTELLDGLVETPVDEPGHVYHMYCVRSPERDRLAAALKDADIGFAVYYQHAAASAAGASLSRALRGRLPGDGEGLARESLPTAVGRDHRGAAGRGRLGPEARLGSRRIVNTTGTL